MLKLGTFDLHQLLTTLEIFFLSKKYQLLQAIVFFIVGILLAKLFTRVVVHLLRLRLKKQLLMVVEKFCYYVSLIIVIIISLERAGLDLKVLLGAAGVFTVAIGFASQTSASNLISGLFLFGERPFVVGDYIEVDGVKGEVLSIDLLSTKLRTFDNLLVRIPNESLIKSRFINLTHFPIRRIDLILSLDYRENLERFRQILLKVVSETFLCLDEPAPKFVILGLAESGVEIRFSIWTKKENYDLLKSLMYEKILNMIQQNGLLVAYPHRVFIQRFDDDKKHSAHFSHPIEPQHEERKA